LFIFRLRADIRFVETSFTGGVEVGPAEWADLSSEQPFGIAVGDLLCCLGG